MLDFRMETFLAVCRYMNFTRAAEKLNITQPAVSQHIRFLEKHYNTKLFRYEGKKLELTEEGCGRAQGYPGEGRSGKAGSS